MQVFFRFILFTICSATLLSCAEEINCEQFREGEFSFTKNSTVRIIRTSSTQKEFDLKNDWVEIYDIHWTGPCSYYLTLQSTTDPEGTTFQKGDTMWVEITATQDEMYSFTAATNQQIFENTMIKLNN